jgi:hypothetical protein
MAIMALWLPPRLDFEEHLETLMSQHKDTLEFHVSHTTLCYLLYFVPVQALVGGPAVIVNPVPGDHS